MPRYLDTRGKSILSIGVCDRCHRKFPLADLHPDRNTPGLRVCEADNDQYDPYRLPARQTEKVNVDNPRPDVPLTD